MRDVPDLAVRLAAFEWLTRWREEHGESIPRTQLASFRVGMTAVPLVGPTGIWKPAACELPISVTTVVAGPYPDSFDQDTGTARYSYRGRDPSHRDNVGVRRAYTERVPLIYFFGLAPGSYAAAYPTYVVADDPRTLTFTLQVDDMTAMFVDEASSLAVRESGVDARRAYVTRTVRQRMHQVAFRERVVRAYQQRCALCSLRHQELLDAAHITPDSDPEGDPVVSNGLALCKLHHAAFDNYFFTVRTDYRIEVRPSILLERDGPMLVVGLQQIHGRTINVPTRHGDRPDPLRLERRYELFRRAS